MNIRLCLLPLAAINLLLLAPHALALRCDNFVIDIGMPRIEVREKCGSPSSQDTHTEHRTIRKRRSSNIDYDDRHALRNYRDRESREVEETIEVVVDEWIYNFGPTRFMQLLVFEDGRLKEIKDLGRGN
ncbi:MAG: hypothetical protein RL497_2207 [Pseudomonadota bacterium]|jgi:hypothetical protein